MVTKTAIPTYTPKSWQTMQNRMRIQDGEKITTALNFTGKRFELVMKAKLEIFTAIPTEKFSLFFLLQAESASQIALPQKQFGAELRGEPRF